MDSNEEVSTFILGALLEVHCRRNHKRQKIRTINLRLHDDLAEFLESLGRRRILCKERDRVERRHAMEIGILVLVVLHGMDDVRNKFLFVNWILLHLDKVRHEFWKHFKEALEKQAKRLGWTDLCKMVYRQSAIAQRDSHVLRSQRVHCTDVR